LAFVSHFVSSLNSYSLIEHLVQESGKENSMKRLSLFVRILAQTIADLDQDPSSRTLLISSQGPIFTVIETSSTKQPTKNKEKTTD
jgi:hypothetical protein